MLTMETLRRAVNAACDCGGGEPNDRCPACAVWHSLRMEGNGEHRAELKQERDIAESWRKVAEGFERDNQRLRAELESDGKIRARLEEELAGARLELTEKAQEIRDLEEALAHATPPGWRAPGPVPAQVSQEEAAAQPVPALPKEIIDLAAAAGFLPPPLASTCWKPAPTTFRSAKQFGEELVSWPENGGFQYERLFEILSEFEGRIAAIEDGAVEIHCDPGAAAQPVPTLPKEILDLAAALKASLEVYDKSDLRGCVVWHRLGGDTVRLLPIPAHIEAMRVVVQVKVFEDGGQAAPLVVTHSAPRGGMAAHTGAPGNSTESREDRDVPP